MALWVDKYRPRSLDDLHYHTALSARVKSMANSGDFPHILMFGPSGAGKKTRVMCTLRELYGPGVEKIRIDQRVFVTASNRKLDVNIVSSNYHIELTPSDLGVHDRAVISDILKEIAQTQQVDLTARQRFKVVVINEADQLTRDAQAALRRTMEKYMTNIRLILCANSTSKIIAPIRSRCLLLRIGAPSHQQIAKVLQHVAKKEKSHLPKSIESNVCESSSRNLRKAILMLEAVKVKNPEMKEQNDRETVRPDWEVYASKTAEMILQAQSAERLLEVRKKLYELLVHCIPAPLILKTLTEDILARTDEELKPAIVQAAAFYEHRLRLGSKSIFHLEAFVAKVMAVMAHHLAGFEYDE